MKAKADHSVKRDRREQKETQIDCGMLLFLYKGGYGELQQFIDFQNGSALIVIPGCWALFIGHAKHLRLWSQSEKAQLSQQALPSAHNPGLRSNPLQPLQLNSFRGGNGMQPRGDADTEAHSQIEDLLHVVQRWWNSSLANGRIPLCHEEEVEEVKGSDKQGKPISLPECAHTSCSCLGH